MRAITSLLFRGAMGLWLLAAGCSSDSDAGNKDQFIAKLCAEYTPCCAAAGRPSDGAQCRAFYGAFAPSTGYDQDAASTCLADIHALGDKKCESGGLDAPSCDKVFASSGGSKKPGEACEQDRDCQKPAEGQAQCRSDFTNGATVQQCQVQMVGKAGSSPCLGTIDGSFTYYSTSSTDGIVPSGYTCNVADGVSCDSMSGACKALGMVGDACSGSQYECVTSAYCSFADRKCTTRVAAGGMCDSSDSCEKGAYCASGTCKTQLAVGDACTSSQECASSDCINGKCGSNNDLTLTFLCGT